MLATATQRAENRREVDHQLFTYYQMPVFPRRRAANRDILPSARISPGAIQKGAHYGSKAHDAVSNCEDSRRKKRGEQKSGSAVSGTSRGHGDWRSKKDRVVCPSRDRQTGSLGPESTRRAKSGHRRDDQYSRQEGGQIPRGQSRQGCDRSAK